MFSLMESPLSSFMRSFILFICQSLCPMASSLWGESCESNLILVEGRRIKFSCVCSESRSGAAPGIVGYEVKERFFIQIPPINNAIGRRRISQSFLEIIQIAH